jgi:hypothetical protein
MSERLSAQLVVVKSTEQVSCALGEESAILNLKNSVYYGLDPVGACIWNLLREPRSLGELRDSLLETYDVEAERCEHNLINLLEEMRAEKLVDVSPALPGPRTLVMDEPAKQEQTPALKKPYSPATLTIYGTVEELTKKVGLHGQRDSGVPPHFKTNV